MLKYFVIIAVTFVTAVGGGFITEAGLDWYSSLNLPATIPDARVYGTVWSIIFLLAAMSATILWTLKLRGKQAQRRRNIAYLFLANAALNVLWPVIFFGLHNIGLALAEALLLNATVIALILLIWPISRISAYLLIPYTLWVTFATYLTYMVFILN